MKTRVSINDKGQVLFMRGNDDAQDCNELWLWDTAVARRLVEDVQWASLNNSGQVVGVCYNRSTVRQNFTYDAKTRALNLFPASSPSPASDTGCLLANINDSGQVAVVIPLFDVNGYLLPQTRLGLTTFANWSPGAGVTMLGTVNCGVESSILNLNAAGEICGNGGATGTAFFASAAAGVVGLGDWVTAMNDSGEVVGRADRCEKLWCPGLAVGDARAARKGDTVTVIATLINTNPIRPASNVVVTAALLEGGTLAAPLPSPDTFAAGKSKTVTLKFTGDTQSGNRTFAMAGTSSLGDFSGTMTIPVP